MARSAPKSNHPINPILSHYRRSDKRGPYRLGGLLALGVLLFSMSSARAMPIAPAIVCETYPSSQTCAGQAPACEFCHVSTNPVVLNPYGMDVFSALEGYIAAPFEIAEFEQSLPLALNDIEGIDSDGDSISNTQEIQAGTLPGDEDSFPGEQICPDPSQLEGLDYRICAYDYSYVYRKIGLDFCGLSPSFEEMEWFNGLFEDEQREALHVLLDTCLDTEFWLGPNGVLWNLAHDKIRPVGSLVDFANFFYDYEYFTYTQIDNHSVRDVLVGQYLVQRFDEGTAEAPQSVYRIVPTREDQPLQPDRRVGMVTAAWPLFYNTMFTALPRGTAAQAYRAFLGLDIARSEGLSWPIEGEPQDFDNAGVGQPVCAGCHSTLDPLAYPFSRYNGLQSDGNIEFFEYDADRILKYYVARYPAMAAMPEAGYLFGQPVADLVEWGQVASESDQFFKATVTDYWQLLMGEKPSTNKPEQYAEFTALWQELQDHDSVEQMLHSFIETEAYGAP